MKRWAFLVAALYALALVALTYPVLQVALFPARPEELLPVFRQWVYWAWVAVMFISQLCLLVVPVRIAGGRPASRCALLFPVVTSGLLIGAMVAGAVFSILEFILRDKGLADRLGDWRFWAPWSVGGLTWVVWAIIFRRITKNQSGEEVIAGQRRCLLRGSILELLIAVPTHIVARYRNYCCGGFMTFIGLTFGIAVMLFAYGPALFFLFVDRWKRLHPTGSA
jgi:hypothetical protein